MTNPGLPPALSQRHHERTAEMVESIRAEIDVLLDRVDAALADTGEAATLTPAA